MCVFLFVLAFALRLIGLDYGYFHGDERVNDAARVLTGELIPSQHFYPPFVHYLNATALGGLFGTGLLAGWWSGPGGFREAYFTDPTPFYVTLRAVTALTSAIMAPLFYLAARKLTLSQWPAVIVALTAVFMPLSVFMAHIAKGDTGLAVAMIATFVALMMRLDTTKPLRWDLLLGLCVALTMSYKHSAIFVLGPLAVGTIVLIAKHEGWAKAFVSFGRALLPIVILWPLLNIGLILDFQNFLDFQKIQSVMSLRPDDISPFAGILTMTHKASQMAFGMTPVIAVMAVLTPAGLLSRHCTLAQKPTLMVIWLSLSAGSLAVAYITGPRQPEHLWIANFAGYTLLASMVFVNLSQAALPLLRYGSGLAIAAGLALSIWATGIVQTQAIAPTNLAQVAAFLETHTQDNRDSTKIIADIPLPLPQKTAAILDEEKRAERLAEKYQITLPPRAEERLQSVEPTNALYHRRLPEVMFGLENTKDGDLAFPIKAHAWPPQTEEWQLEHWRAQQITLFVLKDFETYAALPRPKLRQDFYQSIGTNCQLLAQFDTLKPLFLEREIHVFDCSAP
ncbi:MAG: phospholipid carrier-dependent glycosyltransferase [Thalassovita sp.]